MKTLLFYLNKHKRYAALALLMTIINQGAAFIDPLITGKIVDHLIDKRHSLSPHQFYEGVFLMVGLAFVAVLISRLANNFQDAYSNIVVQKTSADMFSDGLKHSLALPFFEFEDQSSGETIGVLTKVRKDVEGFITSFINIFFMALIGLVFVIVYSLYVSFTVTLLYIVAIPIIVVISWRFSQRIKPMQENIMTKTSELAGSTTESLRNIELVKSLGLSNQRIDSINKDNYDLLDLEIGKIKFTRNVGFIQGTMINAVRSIMIIVLLYLIYQQKLSAGEFFTFLLYSMFLFNPFQDMNKVFQAGREAQVSLKRLKEIINKPLEHVPDNPKSVGKIESITFDKVTFTYPDKKEALHEVSFTVKSGEAIAFVGPSGSGKSTIIKLLARLYSPKPGAIVYNTTDSKEIHKDEIRGKIGIVSQDTQLFSGTIRDNLLLVRPQSNDDECLAVMDKAACAYLADKTGDKLLTVIGEGGLKVSGGERQRLAIARALIRQPDILIFDEATSALDSLTEKDITKTIEDITKAGDHITVLVAHRLSTIKFATRIYVLEKGRIVDCGTHDELLDKKNLYYAMWIQQVGEGS